MGPTTRWHVALVLSTVGFCSQKAGRLSCIQVQGVDHELGVGGKREQCCLQAHLLASLAFAGRHASKQQHATCVAVLAAAAVDQVQLLRRYLQENAKSRDIKLSREEMQALEEAVPASEVVGERYSEQMMKLSHNQN